MLTDSRGNNHGSILPLVPQTHLLLSEPVERLPVSILVSPSLAFTFATLQSLCMAKKQYLRNLGCRGAMAPATRSEKPI